MAAPCKKPEPRYVRSQLYAIADDVEKSKNIPDSISIVPVSA
jgi:hypothetical protein